MKKLVLKKDIVARIKGDQMNHLRGGVGTAGTYVTCDGSCACGTQDTTCWDTCNQATCNGDSCVVCGGY